MKEQNAGNGRDQLDPSLRQVEGDMRRLSRLVGSIAWTVENLERSEALLAESRQLLEQVKMLGAPMEATGMRESPEGQPLEATPPA